jgi:peptide-methionine (S)-S-oxide reductase
MGPSSAKANPSYREVCSGQTGHVEVYDFEYAGGPGVFEELVKHFFKFHDPTTLNRQGNDAGTQYASVIYCYDDEQVVISNKVKDMVQRLVSEKQIIYRDEVVSTLITKATLFYPAEEEHQAYLEKNPGGYCNHSYKFKEYPKF